jgi:hypothetical protein
MNIWLKRVGYTIGAIIALLLIIVSFVYGESESRPRRHYVVAAEVGPVSSDSLSKLTPALVDRAVRHGVGIDGRPLHISRRQLARQWTWSIAHVQYTTSSADMLPRGTRRASS